MSPSMGVTIDEILVGDEAESWTSAGFTVDADGTCRIGTVRVRLMGRDGGKRILGWSLRDAPDARLGGHGWGYTRPAYSLVNSAQTDLAREQIKTLAKLMKDITNG